MKTLYEDVPEQLKEACGWFESKSKPSKICDDAFITKDLFDLTSVDMTADDSLVAYFAGSFGHFHAGHLDVVRRVYDDCKKITDNFVIVISPSNSDYTVEKYGQTSFSTNKHRYNRITEYKHELEKYNVVIDLDPMLNYVTDHVFTIFGQRFVQHKKWDSRVVYIGGKDRDYSKLNDFGVDFWFYPEEKEFSTSNNFKPLEHSKRTLFVRCHDKKEAELFGEYFGEYYKSVIPITIEFEKKVLRQALLTNDKKVATICKDYQDILPYIPFSRIYDTPLDKSYHKDFDSKGYDLIVDSDVFTGGTKTAVEKTGSDFYTVCEFNPYLEECIDIDDFRSEKYTYPYVDVSSRCSLPAFDIAMHNKMKEFILNLKEI